MSDGGKGGLLYVWPLTTLSDGYSILDCYHGYRGNQATGGSQTEGLSSSVFVVEVPATIPADNSGHKVPL